MARAQARARMCEVIDEHAGNRQSETVVARSFLWSRPMTNVGVVCLVLQGVPPLGTCLPSVVQHR